MQEHGLQHTDYDGDLHKRKKHGFRQISQAGTIVNRFTYNWFL